MTSPTAGSQGGQKRQFTHPLKAVTMPVGTRGRGPSWTRGKPKH